jgi:hypothetical protein
MFHKNKWQPQGDDAIKLAALRWFSCTIEAQAIQIYATDSRKYQEMVEALRGCVESLRSISGDVEDSGDCPPGYVLCGENARRCATTKSRRRLRLDEQGG